MNIKAIIYSIIGVALVGMVLFIRYQGNIISENNVTISTMQKTAALKDEMKKRQDAAVQKAVASERRIRARESEVVKELAGMNNETDCPISDNMRVLIERLRGFTPTANSGNT